MTFPVGKLIFAHFLTLIITLYTVQGLEKEEQVNFDTLKLVQVLFRHGDKEPDQAYPDGVGILTDIGKKQLFDLGLYLRGRYNGFLSEIYDPDEIYILSSDKDRTIQSAEMLTYGLYKNFNFAADWSSSSKNGEKIKFEPIPIRSIPVQYDRLLQPSKNCPRRSDIYYEVRLEVGAKFFEENSKLIQYYAKNDPVNGLLLVNTSLNIGARTLDLHLTLEQLTYDKIHNKTLAPWSKRLYESDQFFSLPVAISRAQVGSLEGQRLYSGSLIKHLTDNMDAKIGGEDGIKFRLFSGHDQTMQYLLVSLKMDDLTVLHTPPFGSAIIIELHEDEGEGPFLKFWFRNDSTVEPHLLKHPDCQLFCELGQFKKVTEQLIPTNYEAECMSQQVQNFNGGGQSEHLRGAQRSSAGVEALAVIGLMVSLIAVVLVSVRLKWRKINYIPI